MRQANPIPWKLVGQTICDANGDVVVSALNSCDVETRKMIVAAVNAWMECNPTNNKLREVLEWAKEKAVYIARHYRTPLSLTGNVAELLAYLDAALAVSRATAENSSVVGDCAKMREALEYLRDYAASKGRRLVDAHWLFDTCKAVLEGGAQ